MLIAVESSCTLRVVVEGGAHTDSACELEACDRPPAKFASVAQCRTSKPRRRNDHASNDARVGTHEPHHTAAHSSETVSKRVAVVLNTGAFMSVVEHKLRAPNVVFNVSAKDVVECKKHYLFALRISRSRFDRCEYIVRGCAQARMRARMHNSVHRLIVSRAHR
jgi:hypothetical protein